MLQPMASDDDRQRDTPPTVRREAVGIDDAARLLDVHPMTIRRLIWAGKLRVFRVGRLIRIRRDVLAEFSRSR